MTSHQITGVSRVVGGSGKVLSWDPRTEPCQPALTLPRGPGERAEVRAAGLVELLRDADSFSALVGSTPGEDIAVLEYLLAVVHASGQAPGSDDEWIRRVESGDPEPLKAAAAWLEARPAEDWDLCHPERPLGQNALLAPFMDRHGVGPAQIVIERTGDYNQFFDKMHLSDPAPMPAGVAFRAMLAQHAFGLGGRAMAKADWLGPQLTYQAVGRLGARVRVVALGRTLGDALRLNLDPRHTRTGTFNYSWTDGRRSRRSFRGRKTTRKPDGPADLHSFLGRSILLRPTMDDDRIVVDRVLMAAGELLDPLDPVYLQDAVMVQEKNGEVPLRARDDRAMWREAHALYAAAAKRTKGADLYDRLAQLPARRVNLWAVGLISRQASATAWVSDVFPYVPGRETELLRAARQGSEICEYAAKALYAAAATARDHMYRNPKPGDRAAQVARFNGGPLLWAGAEAPFHALVEEVSEGTAADKGPLARFGRTIRALTEQALDTTLTSKRANGTHEARSEAVRRLASMLNSPKCPVYLRESVNA
ncbi:type I-E CRISPR-associated protein Cse1/CasA [Kitasatospora sp. NPDC056651]|uniref:type I-E CRISPR-associated protein Cse1/CasA n=1 Tax=Kitasatospora sp. NPDC056651 TaxID=3345892 RepID=UPI0036C61F37